MEGRGVILFGILPSDNGIYSLFPIPNQIIAAYKNKKMKTVRDVWDMTA